tara:strand:+ start:335 stop:577 length:243 start_codon:yes stop_codon:yes gene_type:complete
VAVEIAVAVVDLAEVVLAVDFPAVVLPVVDSLAEVDQALVVVTEVGAVAVVWTLAPSLVGSTKTATVCLIRTSSRVQLNS